MLCSKSCGLILALVVGSSSAFSSNHVHQSPSTKQAASSGGFSPSLSRDLKHSSSLEMVSRSSADIAKGLSKEDPIYDYDLFDSKLPTYTHDVVDVVTGKPKDVFNMAKDWSMDGKFWGTALKLESVKDSGKPDMVDSVRKFEDNGREYREKLLNVDNDNYSFAYGYISGSPPVLKAAVTYCTFEPIEGSDFLTKVTWRVVLQPTFEYPSFVALVKKTQSKAYHGLIDLLKSFFSDQNDKITTNKVAGAATLVVKDIASKINDITSTMVGSTGDEKWEYVEYDGFEDGGLPKHCGTLPASAAIMPKRAGMIFQRNLEFVYSQSPLIGYVFELSNILKDPETIVALSKVPGGPFVHKMVESMVGATIPDQMSIAIELKGLLGSPEATKHLMNTQGKHLIDAVNKLADDPYMSPFIDNESFNWMKEPTQIIENFKKDPESYSRREPIENHSGGESRRPSFRTARTQRQIRKVR